MKIAGETVCVFLFFLFGCWLAGQFSFSHYIKIGFGLILATIKAIHSIVSIALTNIALRGKSSPRLPKYTLGVVDMSILIFSFILTIIGAGLILMEAHPSLLLLFFALLIGALLFYSLKPVHRLIYLYHHYEKVSMEDWSPLIREVQRKVLRLVLFPSLAGGSIIAIVLFYLYWHALLPSFWWFILLICLYGYIIGCIAISKYVMELEKLLKKYVEKVMPDKYERN